MVVEVKKDDRIPAEDRKKVEDCELSYVYVKFFLAPIILPFLVCSSTKIILLSLRKKFQSFQDRRIKVSEEEVSNVKRAKTEGNLHEVLLDRRSKQKADRYCK